MVGLGSNGSVAGGAGRYDKAIEVLKELRSKRGGRITVGIQLPLAASYIQAGRTDNARAAVQALLKVVPNVTLKIASRRERNRRTWSGTSARYVRLAFRSDALRQVTSLNACVFNERQMSLAGLNRPLNDQPYSVRFGL